MRDRERYLTKAYTVSRDRARRKFEEIERRSFYGYDDLFLALIALR